jgi:uncharacterized NAD(P)/FAD-binding protein YdhS
MFRPPGIISSRYVPVNGRLKIVILGTERIVRNPRGEIHPECGEHLSQRVVRDSARAQGHTGPIHALSRRGLLPRCHASVPRPPPEHAPFPTSPITKRAFWEMTVVPDIRRQTELVAEYLTGLVRSAAPTVASQTGEQRR